jgi:3-hydroxybutyryl-CoA dehydrogenase
MSIERVAIIGAGTMGSGIAQVFAQAGHRVIMIDVIAEQLSHGMAAIERSTARLVSRERLSAEDRKALLQRIKISASLQDANGVDLALEAVVENLDIKCELLRRLDTMLRPGAILASNTSSLSITRLAAATGHPERVVGIHFMNPAPVIPLVEIVRGLATDDATHQRAIDTVTGLGKTPITVNDSPGFALNRLLIPMINEAVFMLMERVASAQDIDAVAKMGANHPMGPLALADLIGLDVCLSIMEVLHLELGDDKYRPCPLLRNMVAAGRLGRKTGRGFFEYAAQE